MVIEINPRVTCAYAGLAARLDTNLAARVLAAHREAQHETHHEAGDGVHETAQHTAQDGGERICHVA